VSIPRTSAADAVLTPDDLREIESAASKVTIQGARYPETMERMRSPFTNRTLLLRIDGTLIV
jgi:hypothetical protein